MVVESKSIAQIVFGLLFTLICIWFIHIIFVLIGSIIIQNIGNINLQYFRELNDITVNDIGKIFALFMTILIGFFTLLLPFYLLKVAKAKNFRIEFCENEFIYKDMFGRVKKYGYSEIEGVDRMIVDERSKFAIFKIKFINNKEIEFSTAVASVNQKEVSKKMNGLFGRRFKNARCDSWWRAKSRTPYCG